MRLNQNAEGWRYGGDEFNGLVASLKSELAHELKNREIHVVGCSVRRFFRGANIKPSDPTKRLLIIPIKGIATLSPPGDELPMDTLCYIDGKPTLSGDDIDVVFVAFERACINA